MDWVIGTTLVCIFLCFLITGTQVKNHLSHYTNEKFQSKIIMILFMAPIYALLSSSSIWLHDHKSYILFIRDIYESIVIYSFFELLRSYVGYNEEKKRVEDTKIYAILGKKGLHHHTFPFNLFLKPMNLVSEEDGRLLFLEIKRGILQYIPVKIITALIVILDLWEWAWVPGNNFIYYSCTAAVSVSVSIALYYLILFFHILHEELAPYKPLIKFLTIKGILFLTFWQEVVLWLFDTPLHHSRFLPPAEREDTRETISSLLVNVEMIGMSMLTAVAYSYKDFVIGKKQKLKSISDVIKENYSDTLNDLKELVGDKRKKDN